MALMKCPECGKEVSDKAEACPNCGYPIEENSKKQQARHSIHIGKKSQMFIVLSVVLIVILIVCFVSLKRRNVFKEYTDYIGQSYEKLSNDYDTQEIIDGYWSAERVLRAGDEKFAFVNGTIRYNYFEEGSDAYDAKANEIIAMSWNPEYGKITDSDIKDLKKLLEKTYGKFDKEIELDNTSNLYQYKDDSFLCKRYLWNNEKGIELYMDVESEYDDEVGNLYTSIRIIWRKNVK